MLVLHSTVPEDSGDLRILPTVFCVRQNPEKAMYEKNYLRRKHHLERWFSPARFGLFFHWGLFTGGGNTHREADQEHPLSYSTPEALTPDWYDRKSLKKNEKANTRGEMPGQSGQATRNNNSGPF